MESKINFTQIAKENLSLCKLAAGRTKMTTDEVAGHTYTVIGFDFAPKISKETRMPISNPETGEVETYGVVIFDEVPDKYYNVGVVFNKVCQAWLAAFDGNLEAANEMLREQGGVKVMFTRGYTGGGNNIVNAVIM